MGSVDVARIPLAVHVLLEVLAFARGGDDGVCALRDALKSSGAHARGETWVFRHWLGGMGGRAAGCGTEDVEDVAGWRGRAGVSHGRRAAGEGMDLPLRRLLVVARPRRVHAGEVAAAATTAERKDGIVRDMRCGVQWSESSID